MSERVFNPFTGELDSVGINTENATPSNGDIVQYNSTTGLWEFAPNSGSSSLILEEVPSGAIDNVNKIFTLINNVDTQEIIVFLNGLRLRRAATGSASLSTNLTPFGMVALGGQGGLAAGEFLHVSGSASFTLGTAPSAVGLGDFIVVTYKKG